MSPRLAFAISKQPDGASCGPTCLQAIYRFWGDELPLEPIISQIAQLDDGGVLAVQLGCHALRRGYHASISTLNLQLFDPTWFGPQPVDLRAKLRAQVEVKRKAKLRFATEAFLEFIDLGGEVLMHDLTPATLVRSIERGVPLLSGLSATWLYRGARETGIEPVDDDVGGVPQGHFVVLFGWDPEHRRVLVADPERANPISADPIYAVDIDRLIAAIHLGIVTYDANILAIWPGQTQDPESVKILIVVNRPDRWPLSIPGVELVSSRAYLTDPSYSEARGVRVFNLCRSYAYQSLGYYVSLLAEARGHKPQPSVEAIQDMKSQATLRIFSDEINEMISSALAVVRSEEYVLSIYFGRPLARRYARLALALFNQYQAPLLRARFKRDEDGSWALVGIRTIPANEVPESHREFVVEAAEDHFKGRRFAARRSRALRYDLAMLVEPGSRHPPSNERALKRFEQAGRSVGLEVERITRDDYARLSEFDALFIRTTTAVEHYTYRFAMRAQASGLVVIDDPQSIVRAANKVFLAEVLARNGVPIPPTAIVHRGNVEEVAPQLGLPCVLKKPDSAFSVGVVKVSTPEQLASELDRLMAQSELIVAQSFVPTDYDWRVGVLDGQPLYACRYFMASGHWQIMKHEGDETDYGEVETIPVSEAPRSVVRAAVRAANLIGDGLYGVDLKQHGKKVVVIEVNDNPSIDAGFEDRVLKQDLYRTIMASIMARIEERKAPHRRRRSSLGSVS